jgi:hypothetical protein
LKAATLDAFLRSLSRLAWIAPPPFNPRTGEWEPRELHHVILRRAGGKSDPLNLRELRQDWHSEVDAFRIRPGIRTSRGIR